MTLVKLNLDNMLLNKEDKQLFIDYYRDHTIRETADYFKTTERDIETTSKILGLSKHRNTKTWAHIQRDKQRKLEL